MKNNKENLWNDNQEPMDYYLNPPTRLSFSDTRRMILQKRRKRLGIYPLLMEKLKHVCFAGQRTGILIS